MPTDNEKKLVVVTQDVLAPGEHLEGTLVEKLLGDKERIKFRDHKISYDEIMARVGVAKAAKPS